MNGVQREIWLVPFPFSDFSGRKVRPVLILSKDKFNHASQDLIDCGITSNLSKDYYAVHFSKKDLEEGSIMETSCIKAENLLRIDKRILIKKIGKVKKEMLSSVLKKVEEIFQ